MAYGDRGTAPQTTLQLAGAESLPYPQSFQHCANQLAYAALIEAGLQVMDEMNDPIGFWAATICRWARMWRQRLAIPGAGAGGGLPPHPLVPSRREIAAGAALLPAEAS